MPPPAQSALALFVAASAGGWNQELWTPVVGEVLRACLSALQGAPEQASEWVPLEPEEEIDIEYTKESDTDRPSCECSALEDAVAELDPGRRLVITTVLREGLPQELLVAVGVLASLRMMCGCRRRAPKRRALRWRIGSSYQEIE